MTNPSTIWTQLAIPNPASGGIPFVATDNVSIATDVLNFYYDSITTTLYANNLQMQAGGSTSKVSAGGGALYAGLTEYDTPADTTLHTAQIYTIPASLLDTVGEGIEFEAFGKFAANANNKTVKLVVGATTLINQTVATSGSYWKIKGRLLRTGVNSQIALIEYNFGTPTILVMAVALTETIANDMTVQLQNGTASLADIISYSLLVSYFK